MTSASMNLAISDDLPATVAYNQVMLEEENSRVKSLLVATISLYIFGFILGLFLNRAINSATYIVWLFERPWVIWITWFCLFLAYCWIPLSIFLLFQGFSLRKKYSIDSYVGDKTVGNLSIIMPIMFILIYVVTRMLYGA